MNRVVVGIMGPGDGASPADCECAARLAQLIAEEGWVLLTGGRATGVMDAASKAARRAGGLTVGVLPGNDWSQVSDGIDIAILTGIGLTPSSAAMSLIFRRCPAGQRHSSKSRRIEA